MIHTHAPQSRIGKILDTKSEKLVNLLRFKHKRWQNKEIRAKINAETQKCAEFTHFTSYGGTSYEGTSHTRDGNTSDNYNTPYGTKVPAVSNE